MGNACLELQRGQVFLVKNREYNYMKKERNGGKYIRPQIIRDGGPSEIS